MAMERSSSALNPALNVIAESQFVAPLQVTVKRMFGRVHVALVGELDDSTAPFLTQKLHDEVLPDPGDAVVLDIGLVSFIGSAGLSMIQSLRRDLIRQGSSLVVYSPSSIARRLFDITRLSEVLEIKG
jgi:anti-anti-sigma factor